LLLRGGVVAAWPDVLALRAPETCGLFVFESIKAEALAPSVKIKKPVMSFLTSSIVSIVPQTESQVYAAYVEKSVIDVKHQSMENKIRDHRFRHSERSEESCPWAEKMLCYAQYDFLFALM
jgi:hypothetical protein